MLIKTKYDDYIFTKRLSYAAIKYVIAVKVIFQFISLKGYIQCIVSHTKKSRSQKPQQAEGPLNLSGIQTPSSTVLVLDNHILYNSLTK